ncbi:hypothetical protein [Enterococcus avium]|uniref:hypothetical protein n=1 Tax=Enterococcus avium TaxID=33945 RepID=UPI0028910F3E|nr:hypothetical protein [Enterococcus avium]MDT2485045.1 hypothetical protein [Enterococcus avium]MDT2511631.1 hypothetical protein [Enterococcus avium]
MKDLIIWLPNGQTMKFENVTEFTVGLTGITFTYDGVSTGKTRQAVFFDKDMLGYAIS